MEALVWIVGILLVLAGSWWVIRVALAFLIPAKVSGRAYLKKCLVREGIDPRMIPEACIDEFVDLAMKASSFPRPGAVEFRAQVVKYLETIAGIFVG